MAPVGIGPRSRRSGTVACRYAVALALAVALIGLAAIVAGAAATGAVAALPDDFVYLADVAPEVQQDIRYASGHNFTGRPVPGYEAPECILTRAAAYALRKVQQRLPANRALRVYDCYRPERAVAFFIAWARDRNDQKAKSEYYPTIDKQKLFALGYIARSSPHSRGTAVDVAIVDVDRPREPEHEGRRSGACFESRDQDGHDNTLDFGTRYDRFHPFSATTHPGIAAAARSNRDFLVRVMRQEGFANYRREWWHYDFRNERSKGSFDFPVRSRSTHAKQPLLRGGSQGGAGRDVMQFAANDGCGAAARVKIVCVPSTGAAGHTAPSSTSSLTARFLPSSDVLECRRCSGDFGAYSRLDRAGRLTSPSPWCLVEHVSEDGTGSRIGWVDARYLAPADAHEVDCMQ
jgi:D-alanyl-D-alanine dipeptidase